MLPDDFCDWGLIDCAGTLVGFIAVQKGRIPEDPAAWTLCDADGWTIAHEMAWNHRIPSEFDQFDLKDKNGRTVIDVMREVGDKPPDHFENGMSYSGER